jgi:hypothetical protein
MSATPSWVTVYGRKKTEKGLSGNACMPGRLFIHTGRGLGGLLETRSALFFGDSLQAQAPVSPPDRRDFMGFPVNDVAFQCGFHDNRTVSHTPKGKDPYLYRRSGRKGKESRFKA